MGAVYFVGLVLLGALGGWVARVCVLRLRENVRVREEIVATVTPSSDEMDRVVLTESELAGVAPGFQGAVARVQRLQRALEDSGVLRSGDNGAKLAADVLIKAAAARDSSGSVFSRAKKADPV